MVNVVAAPKEYLGPVQPNVNEATYRATGRSVAEYQGPTQPGTNVAVFRATGQSTPSTPSLPSAADISQGNTSPVIQTPSPNVQNQADIQAQQEAAAQMANRQNQINFQMAQASGANVFDPRVLRNLSSNEQDVNSYYSNQDKNNPSGEIPIVKGGRVVGVQSSYLGKTMSLDSYNKEVSRIQSVLPQVKYYDPNTGRLYSGNPLGNNKMNLSLPQVYIDPRTNKPITDINSYMVKNNIPTSKGTFDINAKPTYDISNLPVNFQKAVEKRGEYYYSPQGVVPITPEDVFSVVAPIRAMAAMPIRQAVGFALANLIAPAANYGYEQVPANTPVAKFGKAAVAGYLISRSPSLSKAYLSQFLTGAVSNPVGTAESIYQNPYESAGFLLGTGLINKALNLPFDIGRNVPTERVELKGYDGEVIKQSIPKYGDVYWIKGTNAQSEQVNVIEQINRLAGSKTRVFVSVSPEGVPMRIMSNNEGAMTKLGFEVQQLGNPMRGYYEAPPFKFLEQYSNLLKSNYGALSYYAGSGGRERILENPLNFLSANLTDVFSYQRPMELIRRTFKPIELPDWVSETAKNLNTGKGIPSDYKSIVNQYYNKFLKEPLDFNGKTYVGLEKEKLLNYLNLKAGGDGIKLKVYAALMQFQFDKKVQLPSGAENLAGILPYGAEHQLVSSIGTRLFARSIEDLRKGINPSIKRSVVEFITGTKRGELVANVEGQKVEIQPVRAFAGRELKLPSDFLTGKIGERLITVYHGTDVEGAESILKNGFKKGAYFTKSFNTALDYVPEGGEKAVVLKLQLTEEEFNSARRVGETKWQIKSSISTDRIGVANDFGNKLKVPSKFNEEEVKGKSINDLIRREAPKRVTSPPRVSGFNLLSSRSNMANFMTGTRTTKGTTRVSTRRPESNFMNYLTPRRETPRARASPRVQSRENRSINNYLTPSRQQPRQQRPNTRPTRGREQPPRPRISLIPPQPPNKRKTTQINPQFKKTGKKVKGKPKRQFTTLPTVAEMLSGHYKPGERAKVTITGLEVNRFLSPQRPKSSGSSKPTQQYSKPKLIIPGFARPQKKSAPKGRRGRLIIPGFAMRRRTPVKRKTQSRKKKRR